MDTLPPSAQDMTRRSLGVHTYNPACLMFFAIAGLVMQVPVIYTHSGLFSRPNVPVIVMSVCYMYLMVSTTVSASYWHSGDVKTWWDGSGWCDIDVRLYMAVGLAVLSSQCTINWNIVGLLDDRPKLIFGQRALVRGLIELACCLFIPFVNLAVSTFFMTNRYALTQDLGCSPSTDSSVALIMTFLMWMPFLGAIVLATMVFIGLRFWKRGRASAMETVSFIPHMNSSQFARIIIFSCVVTFVFIPLVVCTSVINFLNLGDSGVHDIAWAHGKPADWDKILAVTFEELAVLASNRDRASLIVNMITKYVNVVIAWLLFVCYGTGLLAAEAYKKAYYTIIRRDSPKKGLDNYDDEPKPSASSSEFTYGSNVHEWDAEFDGAKAFKEWESGMASKYDRTFKGSGPQFSCAPPSLTVKNNMKIKLQLPEKLDALPAISSRETRKPRISMRDLLTGFTFFTFNHKQMNTRSQ